MPPALPPPPLKKRLLVGKQPLPPAFEVPEVKAQPTLASDENLFIKRGRFNGWRVDRPPKMMSRGCASVVTRKINCGLREALIHKSFGKRSIAESSSCFSGSDRRHCKT